MIPDPGDLVRRLRAAGNLERLTTAVIVATTFGVMLIAESIRPLRARTEPRVRRTLRNLTTGAISLAAVALLQIPILVPVARWAAQNKTGLLHLIALPETVRVVVAVVLLDYTLWIWHWMNHMLPVLWRFHLVHHVDRDLDASTALRFHFGEMVLSIGYRMVQIVLIGADARSVWIWQAILFVSILFHHSNLRLPIGVERRLVWFIVTPRMHGIHHSHVREETNSNWSSMLSCWDFLHGTVRLDVPQEIVTIGVPAYSSPEDVTLGRILRMPFSRQRDDWRLPDGKAPEPRDPSVTPGILSA